MPRIYVINYKLITQEDFVVKMKEVARNNTKFSCIKGSMIARAFLETVGNEFFIQYEVNHIFPVNPTFSKYTKVDEIYQRVLMLTIPDEKGGRNYVIY